MADRLQNMTTRQYRDECIEKKVLDIALYSNSPQANRSRRSAGELGWEPIKHEMTNGVKPHTWHWRVVYMPWLQNGVRQPVNYVNYARVFKHAEPVEQGVFVRQGLSQMITFNDQKYIPMTAEDNKAFRDRLYTRLNVPWQLPYIDVWETAIGQSEMYLGRYWLSDTAVDGCEGMIGVFSDARVRNYEKPIAGRWIKTHQDPYYSPFEECHFNKNGDGNIATITTQDKNNRYFVEDWRGSRAIRPQRDKHWTCWDMMLYLWSSRVEYGQSPLAIEIEPPSESDAAWSLWKRVAGDVQKPELNISGLTVSEAIEKIIEASGDFTWTLVPPASPEQKWKIKVFHYTRYLCYGYANANNLVDVVMPNRDIWLPQRDRPVMTSKVNVNDLQGSEHGSQRVGHYILIGDPIIVESTFSTAEYEDWSTANKNAVTQEPVATMEWTGNAAAFQAAYNATVGSKKKKLEAAIAADDVTYRVCSLKRGVASLVNPDAGYAFASSDGSFIQQRRPFLPYRLPQPSSGANDPVEANEKPDIIVWISKPTVPIKWIIAGSEDDTVSGGYQIDPVTGGIRFRNPLVDVSTWTAYHVRVTACIELDERLMIEVGRKGYMGKSAMEVTRGRYKLGMRWNALMMDGVTTANGIIIDNRDEMEDDLRAIFAEMDRFKCSNRFDIPWVERHYRVGDWVGYLKSPNESIGDIRTTEMAVVGVIIDYQNDKTSIRTDNWRQA